MIDDESRRRRAAMTAVVLAAVLPYLPTLDDYFVQDDFGVVWLLSQKPWTSFPGWFVSTWMDDIWGFTPDEIRPFPALTYQVAALFGAGSPVPNHLLNVALHAANGLLVLGLGRSVAGLSLAASACAGVFFALLPVQAESVAWVTGRVDSMPALLYLGSFLLYARWRRQGSARTYTASVAVFFVALFSKQNTITLGPLLVLFDVLIERRPVRVSWHWLRPYVPYALLTVGYLALRYALFGEVARESQLTSPSNLQLFGTLVMRHLRRTLFGGADYGNVWLWALAAMLLLWLVRARPRVTKFLVAWWLIGVAPVIVAAYDSPRHAYLAAAGWAVLLGCALDVAAQPRSLRFAVRTAAAVLLVTYTVQLAAAIRDWGVRARVSYAAVSDLAREVGSAAEGTLVVASAPVRSWEWALPFVLRPPFAGPGLDGRAAVISTQALHCCRGTWDAFTRSTIRTWRSRRTDAPVVVLRWDPESGRVFRLTDREEPYLRSLLQVFADTDSPPALDRAIQDLAGRARPVP